MENLSTLALFDDLRRCSNALTDGTAEIEFYKFLQLFETYQTNYVNTVLEAQRLQREVDDSFSKLADLESKLSHARKLLELENKARRKVEEERDGFEKKMFAVWEVMRNECEITQETKDKFGFMSEYSRKRKSVVSRPSDKQKCNDINSTGSFLSDLSLTRSEDDFLEKSTNCWKKHRPSVTTNQIQIGARRSRKSLNTSNQQKKVSDGGDKLVAYTKVSIPQDGNGPITAESNIEAIPQPTQTPRKMRSTERFNTSVRQSDAHQQSTLGRNMLRPHSFVSKNFFAPEMCNVCQKKIRFGSVALKCRACRVRVHTECGYNMTIACVPQHIGGGGTPNTKSNEAMGLIDDYAPAIGPKVPALIVHCVNEIETRGLQEVGLYRISGAERETKALKERFLRGKEVPCIGNQDIHVLCGCIKDFLRSLRECLIPSNLWSDFSNAVQNVDDEKKSQELFAAIDQLPDANRDTLAFLMQHFQRIANVPEVKMPLTNIAKIFGPTIVGYSSPCLEQQAIFAETHIQFAVLRDLLNISTDYWSNFLNVQFHRVETNLGTGFYDSPTMGSARKGRKYFATPPFSIKKSKV